MILCNMVCIVLTDNKSAAHFDCLCNVELLRLFLFGLSDTPTQISVAVFAPYMSF